MRFATDKVALGYLPTYLGIAAAIGTAGRVCEVGVLRGDSLEMWQALFPDGLVVGVDHDPQAYWPDGTIRIVASQTDENLPGLLQEASAEFDLIVEDASHDGRASRRTWKLLWPLVRPGGWYVIEDWMVGFPSWGGAQHEPDMLMLAVSLLNYLDSPESSVESITYRYGQVILRHA